MTEAFRSAPASVVSPFEYTALPWGIAIDRLVWHVLPSARVLCGGGIVIASGLYLHVARACAGTGGERRNEHEADGREGQNVAPSPTVEDVARKQEEDTP